MNYRVVWCIATVLVVSGTAFEGHAQRSVAAELQVKSGHTVESGVLAKYISVDLKNVTVKHAVNALAASAKARVQFRVADLDAVTAPVSLHASKMTLGDAFTRVLAGTQLQAVPFSADVVTIEAVRSGLVTDGTLVGTIKHAKTQQPVVGATVFGGDATTGVKSGSDGAFRLTLAPGEHTITVRAVGFVRCVQQVTVPDGETVSLNIVLDPSASVLDEVVVTGTVIETERRAIATPITVITADEIEKRAITRIDQLFRGEIPGVWIADEGAMAYSAGNPGWGVNPGAMEKVTMYARGTGDLSGGANPIKTYIDGVELVDPTYLGTLDPQSIERIEIIVGPQAATIYGSGALGGVMQIFTKKGNANGVTDIRAALKYGMLQSNLSSGLTPTHNHSITISGGNGPGFSFTGTVSYSSTGQWQPGLFTRRQGASFGGTYTVGSLKLGTSLSGQNTSNGTADVLDIYGTPYWTQWFQSGLIWPNTTSPNTAHFQNGQRVQRTSRAFGHTYAVNADYRANAYWRHQASVGRNQTLMELDPVSPRFSHYRDTLFEITARDGFRSTMSYSTTVQTPRHWIATTDLTIGYNQSTAKEFQAAGCVADKEDTGFIDCTFDSERASRPRNDREWGGFATARIGIVNRVYFSTGVRLQQNPNYGRSHQIDWTPTNGLTYTFDAANATIKLMGSYGKATRAPETGRRDEVYRNYGQNYEPGYVLVRFPNPQLTPEYSRGPQGGLEVYYGNTWSLTVNHFNQRIDNIMQQVIVDSISRIYLKNNEQSWVRQTQWRNVASIKQFGWEATGSLKLSAISLKGTWSWSDSRILSVHPLAPGTYAVGQSFRNVPTHTGNITIGYANGPASVQLVTNFVGSRPVNRSRMPVYWQTGHPHLRLSEYVVRAKELPKDWSEKGYAKSNLSSFYRLNDRISATVHITNIGDLYRSDASIFTPSLGRQTLLGLSLRSR